jgi:hypothetical protein
MQMDRKKDIMQQKVVDLERGLFCVQYQSADDENSPPKVVVVPAPGHESEVEFFLHPDSDQAVLWQPGSSLVLRTSATAQIHVQVMAARLNGSKAAAVKFEPLTQGTPTSGAHVGRDSLLDNGTDVRLLGHVAGIGDVVVGAREWIAGPTAPSRIEGIEIEWPQKPTGLDLRYAVKSANQPGTPKLVGLQSFAGTRQRALPITSMVLELSGLTASNYQLWAEALFLSSPILRAIGQRVVLSGPTGREPLVGLRIAIQTTEIADERDLPAPVQAVVNKTASLKGKVRVFRSRPKQGAGID